MATSYKNAQVQGTATSTTYATLYTAPASTQAVISTIAVCNTSSSSLTYRVAIMDTEGTPSSQNWIVYDATIPGNDTVFLTAGFTLQAGQVIRIASSATSLAFSAYVSEIS
jgi:hypothetical protein